MIPLGSPQEEQPQCPQGGMGKNGCVMGATGFVGTSLAMAMAAANQAETAAHTRIRERVRVTHPGGGEECLSLSIGSTFEGQLEGCLARGQGLGDREVQPQCSAWRGLAWVLLALGMSW